jgi:hypothetical protein
METKQQPKKKKPEAPTQYSFTLRSTLFDSQVFSFVADTCSILMKPTPRTIEMEQFVTWLESLRELTAIPIPAKIFGSLPNLGYRKPTDELPEIIEKCFQYVESNALQVEGIYRLSGSGAKVEEYVEAFNSGTFVNLGTVSNRFVTS